ncbi:hypothetical protein VMCG_09945 [Cytospora schulzeri]|uniref:DUF7587 domain-containing protein n=1 Tax=Cytospora schulzeri TaxID=448051 RepID=A0A423VFA8_9PEZI|nr:hypothetical protein VMCG_09945 [Valsa malicola]
MAPMAASIDGLLGPMSSLDITADSETPCAPPFAAIEAFVQSVERSALLAKEVQIHDVHVPSPYTTQVRALHSYINRLAEATRLLNATADRISDLAVCSSVQCLVDSGTRSSTIEKLLAHFDQKITLIARKALETSSSGNAHALLRIAEDCYEATRPDGQLDADDYFIPLGEAALGWPYDPDYESEQYYEHEDRLTVDENYAEWHAERFMRKQEQESRERKSWAQFWLRVLNKCPSGPTLFDGADCSDANMPRYLFRVFDQGSSSKCDEDTVASQASASKSGGSRKDLLSLDKFEATDMLFKHLKWYDFEAEAPDNLTSWTSSLLYAVQYAIYRCNNHGLDPEDVRICVVDTTKFPRGQFAQDTHLINELRGYTSGVQEAGQFFKFRLNDERYYNGEYLSQGLVPLTGRSCIVSLGRMELSGLYDLLPELDDERGRKMWANRVLELRTIWSIEQHTTDQEVQTACRISNNCFSPDIVTDMVIMLLCFKNRKILRPKSGKF